LKQVIAGYEAVLRNAVLRNAVSKESREEISEIGD
jgi:hypothetical protein